MPEFLQVPSHDWDRPAAGLAAPRGLATRTEELRSLLADDIVRGKLAPGIALEEAEIARRFGVSRTPVREAIRELAASGLVETRPHRSAIVARPSAQRLRGMFDVLAELEALCAGLSALHMTAEERQTLQGVHEDLAKLVLSSNSELYHRMNERFHGLIYVGSHNDYLTELTLATRARLSPFSHMQFQALGRLTRSHAEHDRVVAAILRRDQAAAAMEMRAHIATVEITYERYVESA